MKAQSPILFSSRAWAGAFAVALTFVAGACGGTVTSDPDGASSGGDAGSAGAGGASTGGASTGGASTGGASTGGASTGGASTGGASTGGASTGGASTGGASTGGASTGGASTGGASTGGASTGGSAGQAGAGGATCVPQTPGSGGFVEYTCDDLAVMNVTDPAVEDDSGDGIVSAGEGATIYASLNEIAGIGFGMYPGVYFTSTDAGVTVKENDWYYAIMACQSYPVSAHADFAASIPPGTEVTIYARVGMINEACLDAYSIAIPIVVQ